MKTKFGDMTMRGLFELCREHDNDSCRYCPIWRANIHTGSGRGSACPANIYEEDLEKEI